MILRASGHFVERRNFMSNKGHKKRILKYFPAFIFAAFILAAAVCFVAFPKSDYSSSEKRYLQKFPDVSAESVLSGEFGSDFESYFADEFPGRNFWVGFNAYYNLAIGNNGADGVYNCSDGYLINAPVFQDNKLAKNIGAITDFAENTDVPVTVMLAPSTGYVASDVLPAVHDEYNDDEYFEQSVAKLAEYGIDFVDLRQTFKDEYASGNQLYYKTDHHWTSYGAYIAYSELCVRLGVEATDIDKFEIETYEDFYGTTYSTSGFWLTGADEIELWKNPADSESNIKVTINDGDESVSSGSMFFEEHLSEDDKYPVFLDGNHAVTEITNSDAEGGTVLLIKDSFSHCLAPFLADNYSKVILVDMRYYKLSVSELAQKENAEQIVVLYGIDNLATDTDIVWLK